MRRGMFSGNSLFPRAYPVVLEGTQHTCGEQLNNGAHPGSHHPEPNRSLPASLTPFVDQGSIALYGLAADLEFREIENNEHERTVAIEQDWLIYISVTVFTTPRRMLTSHSQCVFTALSCRPSHRSSHRDGLLPRYDRKYCHSTSAMS